MGVLLGQNRGRSGAILTPNELIFTFGVLTSDYIFSLLSHISHHFPALNNLICADVPLRNYSLTLTSLPVLVKIDQGMRP